MILVVTVATGLVGCAAAAKPAGKPLGRGKAAPESKIIEDALGRQVEIPALVERVVCLNVGALRYTCYMQAQDRVIAVEDCEKEQVLSRPYNYVNFDYFIRNSSDHGRSIRKRRTGAGVDSVYGSNKKRLEYTHGRCAGRRETICICGWSEF